MSASPENLLIQIEKLIERHDYRQAYLLWQEVRQLADEGYTASTDLFEIRKRIETSARQRREAVSNQLNTLFAEEIDQLDIFQLEEALASFYNATLASDDADYESYRRRYEDRKTRKSNLQEYQRIKSEIEDQWNQARRLTREQRDIASTALLEYYTRALNIAAEAVARNPENTLLEELRRQAEAERENFASEEEVMTSGGQTEDFARVLRFVERRRDDEFVMVYDNAGVPIGRLRKEDARKEVIKNARTYITGKVGSYADLVEGSLKAANPRSALEQLKGYNKFLELDALVPDEQVLRVADRQRYERLSREAAEALAKLERAEAAVDDALKLAADNPLGAWELYTRALRIYEGVFNSQKIVNGLDSIVEAMRSAIQRQSVLIQSSLESYNFDEAERSARDLLARHQVVVDAPEHAAKDNLREETRELLSASATKITAVLRAVEQFHKDALEGQEKRRQISQKLLSIRDMVKTQPRKAEDELILLLRNYSEGLVKNDPHFIEISNQVKTSVNAAQALQDLSQYLTDTDLEHVRSAQQVAQSNAQTVAESYRRAFSDLATQLNFYIQMLEAEGELGAKGYEEAIRRYEAVGQQMALSPDLRERVKNRLSELRAEHETASGNNERLRQLEQILNEPETEEAVRRVWEGLSRFEKFTNPTQSARWMTLFRRSLERLTIETRFNITRLNDLFVTAENIDQAFAERQKTRLGKFMACQRARDLEIAAEWEQALQTWKGVENAVGDDERYYVVSRISALNKRMRQNDKNILIQRISNPDSKGDLNLLLGDITDTANDFRELAARSEAHDRMDYIAWAIELDLNYAQYTPDINKRCDMLTTIGESGLRQLNGAIREFDRQQRMNGGTGRASERARVEEILAEPKRIEKLAEFAPRIGEAVSLVHRHLNEQSDISLFGDAVGKWRAVFYQTENAALLQQGYATLIRWFEELAQRLKTQIYAGIQQAEPQAELNPENLRRYARLLLLDPADQLGQRKLGRLAFLVEPLQREFVLLMNGLPAGQGYEGSIGHEILISQLNKLKEQQEYLSLIVDITERFPTSLRNIAQNSDTELINTSRMINGVLTSVIKAMENLSKAVSDFEKILAAFNLDEANWLRFEDDLRRRHAELVREVDEIGDDLANLFSDYEDQFSGIEIDGFHQLHRLHPIMDDIAVRLEALISRCYVIVNVYKQVKTLAEADQFAEAQTVIRNATTIENAPFKESKVRMLLNSSDLPDQFTIKDSANGADVRGWDKVVSFIDQRRIMLDRILQWSDPFYTDGTDGNAPPLNVVVWSSLKDENIASELEQDASSKAAYRYLMDLVQRDDFSQAVKQQIEALLAGGEFDRAKARLRRALGEGEEKPGRWLSLRDAISQVSQFPLADQENGMTPEYEVATAKAGSKRGKDRLNWIYHHRVRVFVAQEQEARRLLDSIETRRARWEQLKREFVTSLAPVSELVELSRQPKRFGRGERGLNAKEQQEAFIRCDAVQKVLRTMRREFPHHPDIDRFAANPVLQFCQGA
jgi:hypothetical protein